MVHIFLEVNQFRRRVDIKNYLCKWNITSICSRKRPQQRLFKDTCFGILLKTVFLPIDYIISIYSPERSVIIANLSVLSWKGILHSLWCLPSKITGRIRPSSELPNLAWFALKRVNAQKGCSTTSLQWPIHIINLVDKINNLCMTWFDMILMLDQTKLTKVPPVKSDTEINLPIHNPSLFSSGILTAFGNMYFHNLCINFSPW